jgi:hypothetical protein
MERLVLDRLAVANTLKPCWSFRLDVARRHEVLRRS